MSDLQKDIDRLVDDELAGADRRALLERFETEPDGWRQCALAFLEAQSWRSALPEVVREGPAAAEQKSVIQTGDRDWMSGFRQSGFGTLLAMAASFMLAFVFAWQLRPPVDGTAPPLAQGRGQESGESAVLPGEGNQPAGANFASVMLAVQDASGKETGRIRLPVVAAEDGEWNRLSELPSMIPADVIAELESRRAPYRQRREFWPYPLPEGGQLIVPVDQLEVQPAVYRGYQ